MSDSIDDFVRRRLRQDLKLAYRYVWGPEGPYAFEQALLQAFTPSFEATLTADMSMLQRKRWRLRRREKRAKMWRGVDAKTRRELGRISRKGLLN